MRGRVKHLEVLREWGKIHEDITPCFILDYICCRDPKVDKISYMLKHFKYDAKTLHRIVSSNKLDQESQDVFSAKILELEKSTIVVASDINIHIRSVLFMTVNNLNTSEIVTILDLISKCDANAKKYIFANDTNCNNIWECAARKLRTSDIEVLLKFCLENDCFDSNGQLHVFAKWGTLNDMKTLVQIAKITEDVKYENKLALNVALDNRTGHTIELIKYFIDNFTYTIQDIESIIVYCTHASAPYKVLHKKLKALKKLQELQEQQKHPVSNIVIEDNNVLITKSPNGQLKHWVLVK